METKKIKGINEYCDIFHRCNEELKTECFDKDLNCSIKKEIKKSDRLDRKLLEMEISRIPSLSKITGSFYKVGVDFKTNSSIYRRHKAKSKRIETKITSGCDFHKICKEHSLKEECLDNSMDSCNIKDTYRLDRELNRMENNNPSLSNEKNPNLFYKIGIDFNSDTLNEPVYRKRK